MSKALGNTRALELTLVLLCFFSSMLITNDAALLTFVPFSIALLTMTGQQKRILFVVVMQTIAANLGSMLLPVGNPQNIYIYSKSGASLGEFVGVVAPYAGISLVLLLIFILVRKAEPIALGELPENQTVPGKKAVAYDSLLFLLCLLAVFRVLDVKVGFCLVLLGLLVQNRRLILKVDYALLLTFVGFSSLWGIWAESRVSAPWCPGCLPGRSCWWGFSPARSSAMCLPPCFFTISPPTGSPFFWE